MTRHVVVAAFSAVAVPAATALAHGGEAPKGFVSKVTAIRPDVAGLEATIVGGDDELRLENDSGRIVVIDGYDGEPYVRLGPDGVYQNIRSPAVWTSRERMWGAPVPLTADPRAPPEWQKIIGEPQVFEWHDHRTHWMNFVLPPRAAQRPDASFRVFSWTVPGSVDGRPFVIAGTLDYAPRADGTGVPWGAVAAIGTAVVVAVAGALLLVARRRDAARTT